MEESIDRLPLSTPERCRIMLKVLDYVETRRGGLERLFLFLQDDRLLIGVKDLAGMTGWSASWIRKLCQADKLPHIPGKELKFVFPDVFEALRKLQVGGDFGKRRRRTRK